jgi:ribosomal protein S18 acetylase RimI-like enzyme
MSVNGIEFRPALPADADAATPLIYSSGPDVCEYIFKDIDKGSAENFLYFAFKRGGGETGYTNHVCVIYKGEIVGIGAIWSGKNGLQNLLADARKIIAFYGMLKGIGVLIRGLKSEMLIRPPKKNEYALGHLGIDKNLRGKGIGTKLIHYLLEQITLTSNENVILDVSFKNPDAEKLYEKLGFEITGSKLSTLKRAKFKIEVPSHYRMELRHSDKQ